MKKNDHAQRRVCMMVWNHFTHDARVTREAKSLVRNGYAVTVLAMHDRKNAQLPREETREGIRIVRMVLIRPWSSLKALKKSIVTKQPRNIFILYIFKIAVHFLLSVVYAVKAIAVVLFCPFRMGWTFLRRRLFHKLPDEKLRFFLGFALKSLCSVWYGLRVPADVYHCHDLEPLLASYVCSCLKGAHLIYDSHEVATQKTGIKSKRFYRWVETRLIRRAERVIYTTYTRAKFSADTYAIPLPDVISNFADIPDEISPVDLHALLGIGRDAPVILYQGGVQTGRGLEQLIEAVPLIRHAVTLVILGDGRLKKPLEEKVKHMGLESRVRFTGKIPLHELLNYTAGADVGMQVLQNINFNHYSTDSNKLFEYFAAGLPVIASDFPEIAKIVKEFDAGILIDPHEPRAIAVAVDAMLEDPARRRQMADNAKKASLKYNWEREEQRFLDIYAHVFGDGARTEKSDISSGDACLHV